MIAPVVQQTGYPPLQAGDGGSRPTLALQDIQVQPIPIAVAKALLEREHYLHSLPGGTKLAFGVFAGQRLMGALTPGAGPYNAHSLVEGAAPEDCAVLTRLWLSDELPRNAESRVLGVVLRALRRHISVKFVVSYADPRAGHTGVVYQAANFLFLGESEAMPFYRLNGSPPVHSRSLSHRFGTHSLKHFQSHGVPVELVPQMAKFIYVTFISPAWRARLTRPPLPYPKREVLGEGG